VHAGRKGHSHPLWPTDQAQRTCWGTTENTIVLTATVRPRHTPWYTTPHPPAPMTPVVMMRHQHTGEAARSVPLQAHHYLPTTTTTHTHPPSNTQPIAVAEDLTASLWPSRPYVHCH
jgi:hypothetical protein